MKIKPMLGSFALDGIEYIESSESRALVEHRVPGLAGNYFQDMGSVPNAIVIMGSKHGDEARDNFLSGIRGIFNKGEPTTFVADINTATDITDVIIEDLQVTEVGASPDSFRYLLKIRKYVKPPEPPATDLLDTSILDDALGVFDALNTLDALSSISNLGDPTPPVRQSLDAVKAATGGLDGVVSDLNALFDKDVPASPAPAPAPGVGGAAPAMPAPASPAPAPGAEGAAPSGPAIAAPAPAPEVGETAPSAPGAAPQALQIDPTDPRIDPALGKALQQMLAAPETAAAAANLVQGVQDGGLAGIFGEDADAAQQLAAAYGTQPSQLIPAGQDAAMILDPASPLEAPPTILLRSGIGGNPNPSRLPAALQEVDKTFNLWQRHELGPCDSTAAALPVPNLVPSTFCQVPAIPPGPGPGEEPEEIDPAAPDLQIDPADPRIDVGAKFALQRMIKNPDTAVDAARLIRGINGGMLAGIYGDDLGAAVKVAHAHGTERWLLVPKGEDAALVLDADAPLDAPPTVIFRGDTPDIRSKPTRIDPALQKASQTFALWQRRQLGLCAGNASAVPVPNLVPDSFCCVIGQDFLVVVTQEGIGPGLPAPVVSGARVQVESQSSSAEIMVKFTDELGEALFPGLAPGSYLVTASKEGFEEASAEILHPGDQAQTISFAGESRLGASGPLLLQLKQKVGGWFLPDSVRPVTHDNQIKSYLEVEKVWADMRQAIEMATNSGLHFIYLTGWDLGIKTEMGPKGSPNLGDLLKEASDTRGIQIRALLWKRQLDDAWNREALDFINSLKNAQAIHDDCCLNFGSHHQKLLVVNNSDGLVAFCGSMDIHPDRRNWHEMHCRVTGPAARDLHNTFAERWTDFPKWGKSGIITKRPLMALSMSSKSVGGTADVQVVRTYGNGSAHRGIRANPINLDPEGYTFAPHGEQTIYDLIAKGIKNAEVYIYIEDQYLVCSEPMKHGKALSKLLADKLKDAYEGRSKLQKLIILINRTCNFNWETRQGWQRRRSFLMDLKLEDKDPWNPRLIVVQYKESHNVFVHSKTWIFDDEFAIISSANCNRRGYSHDSEVGVGIVDTIPPDPTGERESLVQKIRMDLWEKHLSPTSQAVQTDPSAIGFDRRTLFDPTKAFQLWENLDPAGKLERYDASPPASETGKCPDGDLDPGSWLARLLVQKGLSLDQQWDIAIDPDGS